mmetsp:Transcript_17209/g.25611  ORF Transcript_17209/g.25611 Transcript_17209/m.25611 type:complete len:200 (+) Transcript_17209:2613-3212(+)
MVRGGKSFEGSVPSSFFSCCISLIKEDGCGILAWLFCTGMQSNCCESKSESVTVADAFLCFLFFFFFLEVVPFSAAVLSCLLLDVGCVILVFAAGATDLDFCVRSCDRPSALLCGIFLGGADKEALCGSGFLGRCVKIEFGGGWQDAAASAKDVVKVLHGCVAAVALVVVPILLFNGGCGWEESDSDGHSSFLTTFSFR